MGAVLEKGNEMLVMELMVRVKTMVDERPGTNTCFVDYFN
jgi:hypothetical protein